MRGELLKRLKSAYRHLDDEGWHVHANTIALAIEEINKVRWDIYYHQGFKMVSVWDERVYYPDTRFFFVETIGL
jgi:hypothetical protein